MKYRRQQLVPALDQAASSATNFGGSALAAGLLTPTDFGAYAVVIAVYFIVLGLVRSWTCDVLLLEAHQVGSSARTAQASGSVSTAAACGLALAVPIVAISIGFAHGPLRGALLMLGVTLPTLLAQDATRYVAIVHGRATVALVSDSVWFVLTVIGLMILRRTDTRSVELAILAWAAPAAPAAMIAASALKITAGKRFVAAWLRGCAHLSVRMSVEFMLTVLSGFAALSLIAASTDDLAAAGAIRASQTALGPLVVVFTASMLIFQPEMVRRAAVSLPLRRLALEMTVLNTSVAVVWIFLVSLVPDRIAERVFGESWSEARDVLLLIGAAFIFVALAAGAQNGLRAARRLSEGLAVQMIVGTATVLLTLLGAQSHFSHGAIKGFVIGTSLAPPVAWLLFARPTRRLRSDGGIDAV